ncbi:MAG TPA: NfeD family protein [Acidimicrobiales bacterium]|nr:NfeD family protein [Acidimicrobiales bacterium]
MRRLAALVAIGVGLVIGFTTSPATAQVPERPFERQATEPTATVDDFVPIIKVSGLIDPIVADYIERTITAAENDGALYLVMQLNSGGDVLPRERFVRLAERVRDANVPIGVWVGPSGAKARGGAAQLALLADTVGIAPKSRLGGFGSSLLDKAAFPTSLSDDTIARLRNDTIGSDESALVGASAAPTIGQFLIELPGFRTEIDTSGEQPTVKPLTPVVFSALPLLSNQLHSVASAPVAYLLFLIGLGLLIFEFYTAGVGIAGVVGAGAFVLGCYGFDVLPARWWAVALLVFSMFGFAVDVQTGVPRVWTGIGTACLLVGSFFLYDGVSMTWFAYIAGIGGVLLGMVQGMPAMVRTRFSTPTIGREWMIGEIGTAETNVDPDGVVRVRDALWRARTNRATPIEKGAGVRVAEIEGLVLEVEPEEGAARDYRERARSRKSAPESDHATEGTA